MIMHEFQDMGGITKCLHCKKIFWHCVNRDGTLNTRCVKRRITLD